MIGDHRQPAGGSRPNYHFVTELLEKKTCGLNALPSPLFTPATLPDALTRQIQHGPGTWKKGQGEMPSWGKSTVRVGLCHAKPKQAETVMQGPASSPFAGLRSTFRSARLCASHTGDFRRPVRMQVPEACLFASGGQDATLLMPQRPSLHHLSARPLRSPAGRWLETCRWVSVKDHPEGQSKLGTSLELSWLIADIVLITFGHQIFFVSQHAKIVLQIKSLLHSSFLSACSRASLPIGPKGSPHAQPPAPPPPPKKETRPLELDNAGPPEPPKAKPRAVSHGPQCKLRASRPDRKGCLNREMTSP